MTLLHQVLAALPEPEARKLREILMGRDEEWQWEDAEEILNQLRAAKVERLIREGRKQTERLSGLEREIHQTVLGDLELARRELLGQTAGIERPLAEAKRRYEGVGDLHGQ